MSTDGTVCRTDARSNAFAGPLPACGLLGRVSAWLLLRGGIQSVRRPSEEYIGALKCL
jgi:hypothetical protein